ncbi:MAG: aminoacyl-histidine dipeptidase [Rhodospirillaceae bacterium]
MSESPLAALSPAALWSAFADICAIPHPSRHEAAVIAHLRDRAAAKGLSADIDAKGNLIVRKPATPGRENRPGVILQAPVDKVPQANAATKHDFRADPIRPRVEGDWVYATGTTLGADNGIGAAAMLALMEDETLPHGPLEFLFTVEEEIGLNGARAVAPGVLKGSILLNLDSEDESRITIGCAGGRDLAIHVPMARQAAPAGAEAVTVSIRGLKGGHSGLDIHKGHGNAIRLLARMLRAAADTAPSLRLAAISGGSARNAIPREAEATILLAPAEAAAAKAAIAAVEAEAAAEIAAADPGLVAAIAEAKPGPAFSAAETLAFLRALNACPDGIARLSDSLPGTPETSSNVGVIAAADDGARIVCMVRSSVDAARDALCGRIADAFALAGGSCAPGAPYPGWRPDPNAPILALLSRVYAAQNGNPPEISTVHAGLECAILGAAYPAWQMASIGPNIRAPHSPDERVGIESVANFWNLITGTLAEV